MSKYSSDLRKSLPVNLLAIYCITHCMCTLYNQTKTQQCNAKVEVLELCLWLEDNEVWTYNYELVCIVYNIVE